MTVLGLDLDPQTRCAHWHGPRDVIAVKMHCCRAYYACKDCHDALAGHALTPWPRTLWDEKAVLCGACGHEMSVRDYLACASRCPACAAEFNPGCANHYPFYFDTEVSE
jgi:uncharacterized CHY-type Zn-finger protein